MFQELMEQQWLQRDAQRIIDSNYYPISVSEFKNGLKRRFRKEFHLSDGTGKDGASGKCEGGEAMATDLNSPGCGFVTYVRDENGCVKTKKNPAGEDEPETKPITPDQLKQQKCLPEAEMMLAHEGVHQKSCKDLYKSGRQAEMDSVKWFVENDRDAYKAGVKSLRKSIAELASKCGWQGSSHKFKPDGSRTVPTPDQINELSNNTMRAAKALSKNSARRSR